MTKAEKKLHADAERLRRQFAEHQARADEARIKLSQIEAKLENRPVPLNGLDQLWQMAPESARERSSKHLCRVAWNKVPAAERPPIQTMLDAMSKWIRCNEWRKDGGQFVPALDRWIKERRWENAPEIKDAPSRARHIIKPIAETAPEDAATPEEIAAILRPLQPKRINS